MQTSLNTQLESFPQSSTNLWGEGNKYVQFGYGPQNIFYHTPGQVSISMKAGPINSKKMSTINDANMITRTPNNNN